MINAITLTGVDEGVDLARLVADLCEVSDDRMRIELGVLYRDESGGPPTHGLRRYGSRAFVERFLRASEQFPDSISCALHLCGRSAINDFLRGSRPGGWVYDATLDFNRVQLNLSAHTTDASALFATIEQESDHTVIIQHNATNAALCASLVARAPGQNILFDTSGGRGVLPVSWPRAIAGARCGYAGGLGPTTLAQQLPHIAAASGAQDSWIDMESSLRTVADSFSPALAVVAVAEFRQWRKQALERRTLTAA